MFYFESPLLLTEYIILAIVFLQIEEGMLVVYQYLPIIEFDNDYQCSISFISPFFSTCNCRTVGVLCLYFRDVVDVPAV